LSDLLDFCLVRGTPSSKSYINLILSMSPVSSSK
jgi:hypothetical protein